MITHLGHFRRYEPDNAEITNALYFRDAEGNDFYDVQDNLEGACFLLADPQTNSITSHSTDVSTLAPFDHLLLASDEVLELDETKRWQYTGKAIEAVQPTLDEIKTAKVAELTHAFNAALNAGFTSDALGSTHRYDSETHNRENLIGAVATGVPQMFTCNDNQNSANSKRQRLHTAEQLKQVLIDGAARKQALIARLREKRTAVLAATTIAAVNAITWEDE